MSKPVVLHCIVKYLATTSVPNKNNSCASLAVSYFHPVGLQNELDSVFEVTVLLCR